MKKQKTIFGNLSSGKIRGMTRFFLLLIVAILSTRCAKDVLDKESNLSKTLSANAPDLQQRLAAIKDRFINQGLQEKIRTDQSEKLQWIPDWEKSKIQVVNDSVSYVFYSLTPKVLINGNIESAKQIHGKNYLMVKNETEFYKAFYYDPNVDPNEKIGKETKEFSLKAFTGNLLLTSLQSGPNFLLDYANGSLSASYKKKGTLAIKKIQSIGGSVSYWEQQCHTEVRNCTFSSLSPSWCGGSVNIVFSPTCSWPPSSCGDTYSLVDSDEAVICEDVWFPDPPTDPGDGGGSGGGGGDGDTGTNPPNIEVKQDSLLKHYPCMVKEVLTKLEANQTYGKLVQPFRKIQLPNGGTLEMQGLPNLTYDFSAQDYGGSTTNYSLGTTSDYAGTSSTIRFNSSAMGNASQLLLQAAAIHETGHAYANYYIKAGQYGFPVDTTRYDTWAINIVNFESVANSSVQGGNFNDHSIFLEEYFDNFWGILKEVNGTAYTDKEYQMAALYGLNNPGAAPANPIVGGINIYDIYKGMLNKSFDNIKTKYGITDSELNTFNLDNLVNVPANKKLPTTCP